MIGMIFFSSWRRIRFYSTEAIDAFITSIHDVIVVFQMIKISISIHGSCERLGGEGLCRIVLAPMLIDDV